MPDSKALFGCLDKYLMLGRATLRVNGFSSMSCKRCWRIGFWKNIEDLLARPELPAIIAYC
jgi:hypothetical protein